ncbi:N-acetyltransferase [Vallitalea longa]|uniref:N-acetyltransferase n=1 Tax=Vallitalea longa TaxID=2936439 RepID=A0A9W5YB96_9FIRM|nr:GNAT family N-acetyltransferase [Vallitalea longa]GKX29321.1 N-acetyltransferase [Vallitalea longa]
MTYIAKASINDIEKIMMLIKACVNNMRTNNIDQWDDKYPDIEIVTKDITEGNLYIMKDDDNIYGMVTINEKQEDEYSEVIWRSDSSKILVVHRLAVDPQVQGNDIGKSLMKFAEDSAILKHYDSIRLDTYCGNPIALDFYRKLGYERVGHIYFPHKELPFYCYDKIMTDL